MALLDPFPTAAARQDFTWHPLWAFVLFVWSVTLSPPLAVAEVVILETVAQSPLEARLVEDQIRLYLLSLKEEFGDSDLRYEMSIRLSHSGGRIFDYTVKLQTGSRNLGRQMGRVSFEEFRHGFGRAFESVVTSSPGVSIVSLERFEAHWDGVSRQERLLAEVDHLRRAFVRRLEATAGIVVMERADFAHRRLRVDLRRGKTGRLEVHLWLDGDQLEPISSADGDLWPGVLEIASRISGRRLERVRLQLFEVGQGSEKSRSLHRGPMDYRIEKSLRIRQARSDGSSYPVLAERGQALTILRFGYYPRTVRILPGLGDYRQVNLIAKTARYSVEVLAGGELVGPIQMLGYDGDRLEVEPGRLFSLKREYKYHYSMTLLRQRGIELMAGWFIVPDSGDFELFDEGFPGNLRIVPYEAAP